MQRYVIRCLMCAAMVCAVSAWAAPLSAQEILSGDVLRVTGPFSVDQRQLVQTYLDQWTRQMLAGENLAAVADARRKLVDPLIQPGVSEQFKNQYSALIAPAISPGVSSKDSVVRLNTLIVIGNCTGGAGVDQMIAGLRDKDAAVRYWAAKAIAQSLSTQAGVSVLPADQRNRIQKAISEMMPAEKSADVVEQMYDAMATINTPESLRALVDAMNGRVAHYLQQGDLHGMQAERTGLRRLYRVALEAQIQGQAKPALIKDTAAACQRYLELISAVVAKGQIPNDHIAIAQDIVEVSQTTLGWAVKVFDPAVTPGPKLIDAFRAGDKDKFVQFRLNVIEWGKLLKTSAIALTDEQLKL